VYFWLEPTFRGNVSPPSSGQVNSDENIVSRCLQMVGNRSAKSQKTVSSVVIAVKTSNLTQINVVLTTLPHVLMIPFNIVIIDGVRIGNCIYWPLTGRNFK
jgi:hypothetical protein